jgi:hypothetical protein
METQNELRGRGRPSKYSNEQIEQALNMVRNGSTLSAAAKASGLTPQNVMYYKKRAGISGASVPGVLPTVAVDPLTSVEESLLAKYDGEIGRLEATIAKATARLKETVTKRRRVARALGLLEQAPEATEPEVTVEPELSLAQEFAKLGAKTFHEG